MRRDEGLRDEDDNRCISKKKKKKSEGRKMSTARRFKKTVLTIMKKVRVTGSQTPIQPCC